MGFGIRLAPGIRLSASSRGLRMGIGPRIARVHVGAGRTGFSTGLGPITYYTSAGGRRRSRSGGGRAAGGRVPARAAPAGPTRAQIAQLQREARRQAAEEAYRALVTLEQRLTSLHLETFPTTVAPPDLGPEPLTGLSTETAAVAVEVYRRDGGWRVRAVGQGWADGLAGLARDFGIDVAED